MPHILLLTPQLPYPPHQGTSLRNFHILRGLAQRHAVTLLSFDERDGLTTAVPPPLQELCARVVTVPLPARTTALRLRQLATTSLPDMAHRLASPLFNTALRQLLQQHTFDIVQIEGIELARVIPVIRAASPRSKIVFDNHNAETELQWRNFLTDLKRPSRWPAAGYSWLQTGRLRRFETWAMQQADGVTAVSDTDRDHLAKLRNRPLPITVIPNSIDVPTYQTPPESLSHFDLMFSGKMDYRPNVDAVLWFAQAVWPRIVAERPSTTWAIVGQKPHARLAPLRGQPGIVITGWVESVRPFLHGASVPIMPFRIGSGTRLKIIEAMAAGRAIVSTPVGAEGFAVQDGRELLLAETAEAFATAVLQLLDDETARAELGAAAFAFAQQYDWRVVVPRFFALYAQLGV